MVKIRILFQSGVNPMVLWVENMTHLQNIVKKVDDGEFEGWEYLS